MNTKIYTFFTIILLTTIIACKKSEKTDTQNSTSAPKDVDVYICGSTPTQPYNLIACYWKNGVVNKVADNTQSSYANAIVVSGNDVYMVGGIYTTTSLLVQLVYWKNGVEHIIGDAVANSIAVSGNDVYLAGYTMRNGVYIATYWKNGIPVYLNSANEYGSSASSIIISGSDVYVSGSLENKSGVNVAMYWKNDVPTQLSTMWSAADAITIQGNDVYVSGFTKPTVSSRLTTATYWKNGVAKNVSDDNGEAEAAFIVVNGTDIYLGGSSGNTPLTTYWKNGTPTVLSYDYQQSATGFAVNGTDVYTVGKYNNNGVATYWKNSTMITLPGGESAAGVTLVAK